MALSVVKRPPSLKIDTATKFTATYTNGGTDLTAAFPPTLNSYVYISSGQYMGFWYTDSTGLNTFNLREYPGDSIKVFSGAGSIDFYYTISTSISWSAVHLPIVYKLKSDLWPTNSVDTARTVSSFANDNGFVKLTLSGALLSSLSELEFLKITGIGEAGVYQILTWYSTSVVTINMPYYSNLSFGPATVQYYYNNYRAKIRLYAGLTSSHIYASLKPYTLLVEKELVPDVNGIITLNINEDLKSRIEILKNDLQTGTAPNNLNAWIQYYIDYAEAYDYSAGGYGLLDFVGSYTSDRGTFEGYAANASLPFKNKYSGSLADYLYGSSGVGFIGIKFLTAMTYPVAFNSYYDISYIDQFGLSGTNRSMRVEYVRNGTIVGTTIDTITNGGIGICRYRVQLSSSFNEDTILLTLRSNGVVISKTLSISVDTTCYAFCVDISWLNYLGGFDYWRFKGFADYGNDITQTIEDKRNILPEWPQSYGEGADTVHREISRTSRQTVVLRAENLTANQVNDLYRVKLSPLVQIVNSATDKRTVIPDRSSFTHYPQANKLFTFSFTVTYTDENPVQSL